MAPGMMTHMGVDAAARAALGLGFACTAVRDALGATRDPALRAR
ncbi:MAG: isochorismatase family protein [Thermaerobacter sp.]|nr:isochorismatase family protein [Thermaerobacter sp.]